MVKRKMAMTKKLKGRSPIYQGEIGLDIAVYTIAILVLIATFYPFLYVFSMSISDPGAVVAGKVKLFPIGFNLGAYKIIIQNPEIWNKLYNTIWIVVIGTAFNVLLTVLAAYPLSRKELPLKGFFMLLVTFTLFFKGGMIPTYLLVKDLGLMNTRWSVILPIAANAWYIIIARTYFKTIPESLLDSAKIDGCKHFRILFRIIMPLSLPIIAVIVLYGAVNHWNSYFQAMIYITETKLQPLQLYLVRVLVSNDSDKMLSEVRDMAMGDRQSYREQLKYAIIVFTIFPIIGAYPFLQRYFIKGLLIGSVKE